jgi:hypothetical protein
MGEKRDKRVLKKERKKERMGRNKDGFIHTSFA